MKTLCDTISDVVRSTPGCAHWFGGDFNLPDIDWTTDTVVSHQYLKEINTSLIDTLDKCNLDQIVDFTTRGHNILEIFLALYHCKFLMVFSKLEISTSFLFCLKYFVNPTPRSNPNVKPTKRYIISII